MTAVSRCDEFGGAIAPDGLAQIESLIPAANDLDAVKTMKFDSAVKQNKIEIFDIRPAYMQRIASLIDVEPIKKAGLKVVIDNMWGNGSGWLSEILSGGKTQVIDVHAERNPIFPEMKRPEPIPECGCWFGSGKRNMPTVSVSWMATPTAVALATKMANLSIN